jgi:uncharacterized protein
VSTDSPSPQPLAPGKSPAQGTPLGPPGGARQPDDAEPISDEALAKLKNYLEIKVTPERATLNLKSNHLLEKIVPTAGGLKRALQQSGATHGLDKDLLARIVAEKLFDRTHIVAQSVPPKDGADARIEVVVSVSGEAKPVVLADGSTDYRNVDNIHQVAAGAVLQIKHPAQVGQNGIDVEGKALPAKSGADIQLKPGFNTEVSPDGLRLLATRGGYLFLKGDVIGVGEDFQLQGDVNFKTGNITYHGDVQIAGNVADGFRVEADGKIVIEGSVDGAVITSKTGSVTIKGAVFGHGRTEIRAATDIQILAAQDAHIDCGGLMTVEKELRNCKTQCFGIQADSPGCHVMGGTLTSYGETRLAVVGAEGVRTEVKVGDKAQEEARGQLATTGQKLESLKGVQGGIEQKLKQIKLTADRLHGHISPRMAADLKGLVQRYGEIQKAVRTLGEESERLRHLLSKPLEKRWPVVITEKVVDSAHLKLYGLHHDLTPPDAPGQWLWTDQGLTKAAL